MGTNLGPITNDIPLPTPRKQDQSLVDVLLASGEDEGVDAVIASSFTDDEAQEIYRGIQDDLFVEDARTRILDGPPDYYDERILRL